MMERERYMKDRGIRSIGFIRASDAIPHDSYSVELEGYPLGKHVGIGSTVESAYQKACDKCFGRAAA